MVSTSRRKSSGSKSTPWATVFTWDTKNPEQDRQTARETWNLCVEKLRSGDYDMLVFDELVYVLSYEMLQLPKSWKKSARPANASPPFTSWSPAATLPKN